MWAGSIALMEAPDEPAHAIRAAAVARGEWQSGSTMGRGVLGARVPRTSVRVPSAYADLPALRTCRLDPRLPALCAPPVASTNGPEVDATTYVGAYQPTYYLAVGWPSVVLGPPGALFAMRAIGAVVCAAVLASAVLSLIECGGGPISLLGVAAAVTPMTAFLAASINPNGVEVVAAIGLWVSLLVLLSDTGAPSGRVIIRAATAAALLVTVRPLSPAFGAAIVAVVAMVGLSTPRARVLTADRRVRWAALVVAVAGLASTVFVVVNHSATTVISWPTAPQSLVERLRSSAGLTGAHLEEAVGLLSWKGVGEVHLPDLVWQSWIAVTAALALVALRLGSTRERVALLAVISGGLGMPIVATLSAPSTPWQGRYALPLLVGIPILSGWIIDRRADGRRLDVAVAGSARWSSVGLSCSPTWWWCRGTSPASIGGCWTA